MKTALPLFLAIVFFGRAVKCAEPPSWWDKFVQEQKEAGAKESAALKKAGLISNRYQPKLLFEAAAARAGKQDPLSVAKTPEQRRFLTEYLKVQAEGDLMRERMDYQWVEPLRRCGIVFPPGARLIWLPFNSPLVVIHTPKATRQIEKYMGLEPHP